MVFICAPLSGRAMKLSPLILILATFSILYHQLNGLGFKKGVCVWHFMPWASHPGAPLVWSPSLRGLGSLIQCCLLISLQIWLHSRCHHQWTKPDKVIWAATVITVLLLLLSALHCSGKVYNEFLSHVFNAIWVHTVSAFLFVSTFLLQVCHPHSRDLSWLTAFKLS